MNPVEKALVETEDAVDEQEDQSIEDLFQEVDLFRTALIQGGCTDQPAY